MTHIDRVELDPKEYGEAVEVRGVVVEGHPEFVLISTGSAWDFFAVMHPDTDGFGGQHIDGFATLEQARSAADPQVRGFLYNPA